MKDFMTKFQSINKKLDSDSQDEKIRTLESLTHEEDPNIINKIISKLDDPQIQVRGEAFSSLVLNENKISKFLIKNLSSPSENIRGFSALILANRNDREAISSIIELTKDSSSMVRACALGALGFLKANDASKAIHNCLYDSSIEVKKSAVKAAIDIGDKLLSDEIQKISKEKDDELEKLLVLAAKKC